MKRIPKQFQLGSYTIKVSILPEPEFVKKVGIEAYGCWDPNTLTIYLVQWPPRNRGAKEIIFQTFWHEWCHAALWCSVRPKLHTDEKLVDNLGHSLAQLMTTSVFD